jgi:glycine cleavage system transcriptional repressor
MTMSWGWIMKTYSILSAFGKDRPGIVADVAEVIYEGGGNIEDSSMGCLGSHFALLILFSMEKERIQELPSRLKQLEREKGLTVFYSPVALQEVRPVPHEALPHYRITTSGVDHTGIVFKVCRFLADRKINVIDMETRRTSSAESGTPLFEMDIEVEVPKSVTDQTLRGDLHDLANELVIDLVLKKF